MPIQNVGTVIENLAVAEAASLLLERLEPGQTLVFANAFAMPALSEWRPHTQSVGISSEALQRVAESRGGGDFVDAMRRCLQYRPDRGPNGVLLVSVLAALREADLSIWANDIAAGHYGNAIPSLRGVAELAEQIVPGSGGTIRCETCDVPYPASIDHLESTVRQWRSAGASLGFLDPMRYVLEERPGPYTHSSDHRRWLSVLREMPSPVAVHFTGNNHWPLLRKELAALRADLSCSGFPHSLEVRRQHYVVVVGAADRGLLDAIRSRIESSWSDWCDRVPEIKTRKLRIYRYEGSKRAGQETPER